MDGHAATLKTEREMRKFILSALTMLLCGSAYALPVGNPTEASLYTNGVWWSRSSCDPCDPCGSWCDAFSVRLGFYGDYVFNRHLEVKSSSADIDRTQIFTNAGIVVLNVFDWIDIFGTFGATSITLSTDPEVFHSVTGELIGCVYSPEFSWSVGGRATLWECGCFGVGIEGQYFRTQPNLDRIYHDVNIFHPSTNNGATYSEWQVGVGASYTFTTGCPGIAFIPYMGLKWAGSTFNMNTSSGGNTQANTNFYRFSDLEADKLWGYAVGLTAVVNEVVGATVEARFGDEKAVSATMQIRF